MTTGPFDRANEVDDVGALAILPSHEVDFHPMIPGPKSADEERVAEAIVRQKTLDGLPARSARSPCRGT